MVVSGTRIPSSIAPLLFPPQHTNVHNLFQLLVITISVTIIPSSMTPKYLSLIRPFTCSVSSDPMTRFCEMAMNNLVVVFYVHMWQVFSHGLNQSIGSRKYAKSKHILWILSHFPQNMSRDIINL